MKSEKVNEISVFVDESGSFEPGEESSRFYLICFVLHDQSADIEPLVDHLEEWLETTGLGRSHCVHVGPLIRREGIYRDMQREQRQAIFRKMMAFVRKADISYHCFRIDKHYNDGDSAVHDTLLQAINRFLIDHSALLNTYGRLKVYYDNGQARVKAILEEAFKMFSSIVEFVPDVRPERYRLFQVADLLCTIELVSSKIANGGMSESERRFLGDVRDFKRNVLRKLKSKEL